MSRRLRVVTGGAFITLLAVFTFATHSTAAYATTGAATSTSSTTTTAPSAAAPTSAACNTQPAQVTDVVVPEDCWGRFPTSHYDIGCDEGAWNNVGRKVYCALTDMTFQISRGLTAASLWLVGWAFQLDVHSRLGAFALEVAHRLHTNLIGPLNLAHAVWLYAIAWTALHAMRGRVAFAGGELLVSIVVAVAAAFVFANPAGYLTGVFDTMHGAANTLLAVGTGQHLDTATTTTTVRPVQAALQHAFIEDPYDVLDWGEPLTGACARARDEILTTGPHGDSDDPRQVMTAAGCTAQAEFNHDPSGNRLFGALLTLAASAAVVVLLGMVAMTLVVAQVFAIVLFGFAPGALLTGILPGGGRELLWRWCAALLRCVVAVVGMSFVLAVLLLVVTAVLEGSAQVGLVERFALLNAVVIAMFIARKRILAAGHSWAGQVGQRLAARRAGSARHAAWMTSPTVAGTTGFAVGAAVGMDRASRTSRLASTIGRDRLAQRRLARHTRRGAATIHTRERSEIGVNPLGLAVTRSVVTVDGPVARTRRARAARAKVEQRAARRYLRRHTNDGTWDESPDDDEDRDVVDVEEA